MKPPKKPKSLVGKILDIAEAKIARDIRKRLMLLQKEFDIRDWKNALNTLDPTALNNLLNSLSMANVGDNPLVDSITEIMRQSAREALMDWSKNKAKLYLPFGRPEAVQILNAPSFANYEATVDLPDWARPVESAKLKINFNAADENVNIWAKRRAGELITAIDDQTRQGVRQIIHEAVSQGIDVDRTAKRIQNVVGLHPRWAQAVSTYEQKQYARLIREGLTPSNASAKASELAGKYRDTLVRKRSQMIARTEIMTVSNKGRELGWSALGEAGLIDPVSEKEWITAPLGSSYGEPCETCQSMRGMKVRYNQSFPNGLFTPPAHPHCRCTVRLVPPSRGLTQVNLD